MNTILYNVHPFPPIPIEMSSLNDVLIADFRFRGERPSKNVLFLLYTYILFDEALVVP